MSKIPGQHTIDIHFNIKDVKKDFSHCSFSWTGTVDGEAVVGGTGGGTVDKGFGWLTDAVETVVK